MGVEINVPADEHLARIELISWLAYPRNERLRQRARKVLVDLARHHIGLRTELRRDRLYAALRRIDLNLDRNLLAGEYFRRQVWELDAFLPASFGVVSTKYISRFLTEKRYSTDEREVRRMFSNASPILHLAVGACDGLAERPGILTRRAHGAAGIAGREVPGLLLDGSRKWTASAVHVAGEISARASKINHPRANDLVALSIFPLPLLS